MASVAPAASVSYGHSSPAGIHVGFAPRNPPLLRNRGRLFRIGPRNASVVGLMSRVSSSSARLRVVQSTDVTMVLPGILRVESVPSFEDNKQNASIQTHSTPNNLMPCDAEHEAVCSYIDNILDLEDGVVSEDLLCPITHRSIRVPVVAPDGVTYEHSAISRWLRTSSTSPVTRENLRVYGDVDSHDVPLYMNKALRNMTQKWAREHAKGGLTCVQVSLT